LIKVQRPDGHYGDPTTSGDVKDSDMAIMWGNGRMLVGLMEAYRSGKRAEVLQAARSLGDFFVKAGPLLNSDAVRKKYSDVESFAVGYICWTQTIEGLVSLYTVTKDDRYLHLAQEVTDRTEYYPGQHSHGFLTSVRGVLELAIATGDSKYMEKAERLWAQVVNSDNLMIQGAIPERFQPRRGRTEGCSEADWLRLSLALWRVTGKKQYLEHAERTLFNEFYFNQFQSGDYGSYDQTRTGVGRNYERCWWCCSLHGLRAFPDILGSVFRSRGDALFYDLAVDGQGRAGALEVRANSSLETDESVQLEIVKADGHERTISVRQPEWAGEVALSIGKTPAKNFMARGSWLSMST
jgi:DUF1680 family protein